MDHSRNKSENKDSKYLYKEFSKIYLKIKFEDLNNKHFGQNIPPNLIWKEATKQSITRKDWGEFILKELKNYEKYSKSLNKQNKNKYDLI